MSLEQDIADFINQLKRGTDSPHVEIKGDFVRVFMDSHSGFQVPKDRFVHTLRNTHVNTERAEFDRSFTLELLKDMEFLCAQFMTGYDSEASHDGATVLFNRDDEKSSKTEASNPLDSAAQSHIGIGDRASIAHPLFDLKSASATHIEDAQTVDVAPSEVPSDAGVALASKSITLTG